MVNFTCNSTLDDLRNTDTEVPLFGSTTFHDLGIGLCAGFTAVAGIVSFYLIMMHAMNYTKPHEQRHIIRILFMIPVYAAASCLSFVYYWHAIYFQVISDCYEAFAIAAFFSLLCHYIAPNLHDQKEFFRALRTRSWIWPLTWFKRCFGGENGLLRTPRSGLTWFNIIWFCVFQYCFIRVSMTITSVLTQMAGRYCGSSSSPLFAHIWIECIEVVAVSVAMYCLIQFYLQLRAELKANSPFLKILSIKLVIFLSFWQSLLISSLISSGVIKPTATIVYPDLNVGIPALMVCIEMAMFSVLYLFAFPYSPYQNTVATKYPIPGTMVLAPGFDDQLLPKQGGRWGIRALGDAFNLWDLVKAFARGSRWMFVGRKSREQDVSYKANLSDLSLRPRLADDESLLSVSASCAPIAAEAQMAGRSGRNDDDEEDLHYNQHVLPKSNL